MKISCRRQDCGGVLSKESFYKKAFRQVKGVLPLHDDIRRKKRALDSFVQDNQDVLSGPSPKGGPEARATAERYLKTLQRDLAEAEAKVQKRTHNINRLEDTTLEGMDRQLDTDAPFGQDIDQYMEQSQKEAGATETATARQKQQTTGLDNQYKEAGGPALQPDKEKKDERKKKETDELKDNAGSELRERAGQAIKQTAKQIGNSIRKAVVQATAKIAASLVANPYVWLVVAILIAIIIMVIVFASIFSRGGTSPNTNGATFTRAIDPLQDKPLLKKIQANMMSSSLTKDELSQLKIELENVKPEVDDATKAKIDQAISLIGSFNSNAVNSQSSDGQKILTLLVDIVKSINPCAQVGTDPFFKFGSYENSDSAKRLINDKALRPDGKTEVSVDIRVCSALLALEANKATIGISQVSINCIANHHDDSKSGPANHWNGHAVDLDWNDTDGPKVMQWLAANKDSLGSVLPNQVIGPLTQYVIWNGRVGDAAHYSNDTLCGHGANVPCDPKSKGPKHIHFGFK